MSILIPSKEPGVLQDAETLQTYNPDINAYQDCDSALAHDGDAWREVWPERSKEPAEGLVAKYMFGDAGDIQVDSSGNGNTLYLYNASILTGGGPNGENCMYIDAPNDNQAYNNNMVPKTITNPFRDGLKGFTLSAWIRKKDYCTDQVVFSCGDTERNYETWNGKREIFVKFANAAETYSVTIHANDEITNRSASFNYKAPYIGGGSYAHCVFCFDGTAGIASYYENGVKLFQQSDLMSVMKGFENWPICFGLPNICYEIERWGVGSGRGWYMSRIRLYNRALTLEEVNILYNNGKGL